MDDEELGYTPATEEDVKPMRLITEVQRLGLDMLRSGADIDKGAVALMSSLKGTAVAVLNIETDDTNAKLDREAGIAMVNVLKGVGDNPFLSEGNGVQPSPTLPDIIPLLDETSVVISELEFTPDT